MACSKSSNNATFSIGANVSVLHTGSVVSDETGIATVGCTKLPAASSGVSYRIPPVRISALVERKC